MHPEKLMMNIQDFCELLQIELKEEHPITPETHFKELENYDCYIDDTENLAVAKFLNRDDVVMIPNLTYYPRASFLPRDTITDGSVALLTLKNGSRFPTEKDLEYYGSKEFEKFYRVARNYGTRSLNIDNNSVFFFGLLKEIE